MFWQMTSIEHHKLFKRSILWVEIALMSLGMAGLYVALYFIAQTALSGDMATVENISEIEQVLVWPMGLVNTLDFSAGSNLGGLLIIVLVGAVTAQEYTQRTLQLWLSRGIRRPLFLGSKFAALLIPALLIVVTPLLVGGAITAGFSQLFNGSIPFEQVNWLQLGWGILLTAYTLLPYAAMTLFLSVTSRSTVVAIGGGLTYVLVIEGLVVQLLSMAGGVWAQISQYTLSSLTKSLLSTNSGIMVDMGTPMVTQFMEPGTAALAIAIYVLIFMGASFIIFQRQDLSG